MKSEIEAKFLQIDIDSVRQQLQSAGAVCVAPMRLMRRAIIDYPDRQLQAKNAYIRVRDEGDKVTLTYKQFDALSVDGAKEIDTTVESFDAAVGVFQATGLVVQSLQESKRETWTLGPAEIVIDIWPWLRPYIEVEAPSTEELEAAVKALGLDMSTAVYGDVMAAYRTDYPHLSNTDTVGNLSEVRFDAPLPALLKSGT